MLSRSLAGLLLACNAALLAPLFGPLLTGRVFVYNDLSWFHLPLRFLYQQAMREGDTVLWTPAIFSGLYLHGEGQAGLFHPFHQLLYRVFPLGVAFNFEILANYPLAFAGMYWLLRRFQFSQAASLFGAMLFAFGGFNLLHYQHVNMVAVVAHMPWLLAAADVLLMERGRWHSTIALGVVALILGSELLLGFPQAVWWNILALTTFGLFRAWESKQWRRLALCAGAIGLGILLGGIQLLPTVDAASHSMRAGLSRDFALTYSLHPSNLLQLWSPYVFPEGAHSVGEPMWFHEFGIYSGAMSLVAVAWTWTRRSVLTERRALIAWATAVAALALILALGRYGGLAALLTYVPGLQSIRVPARYIVLTQFALAILATITFDDLLAVVEGSREPPKPGVSFWLWIPLILGIATTVALNGRLLLWRGYVFADTASGAQGVAIVAIVTLLVSLAARRARWALAALIVVTAADLGLWGINFVTRERPRSIAGLTGALPVPTSPVDRYAAAPTNGRYTSNVLVLAGYRLTNGYVALLPASQHPLDSAASLQLSGTRWKFAADGVRQPFEGGVARVRLLDEQGREATGTALLAVDRPGRLVAQVDVPARRVLALTERFHHGWSGSIDGVTSPTIRVDGDFLGCIVDAGVHRVEFSFMPRSFVYGAIMSVIGAVLLVGVIAVRLR